ncbi:MAG: DUF364 domain-containing protein, partial [Syntrophomonadaceae bacterium]
GRDWIGMNITIPNNPMLAETIDHVRAILGDRLDRLTVERAVIGLFFTGVKLSDGHGGLCFTPIKEIPEAVCCPSSARAMPLSGKLAGRKVSSYLDDIFKDNVLKKTLGIAALNALSAACWDLMPPKDYNFELGRDSFDGLEIAPGSKAVVVGALVPMIRKLIEAEADFCILELDPLTLKPHEMPYFAEASRAPEFVPAADLLVITGTTIINNTLQGLLSLAKPGVEIVVTGPTVSMLPDAFFARGVTSLGGILVTNPDELLDIISEAGSGYHFFGKSAQMLLISKRK